MGIIFHLIFSSCLLQRLDRFFHQRKISWNSNIVNIYLIPSSIFTFFLLYFVLHLAPISPPCPPLSDSHWHISILSFNSWSMYFICGKYCDLQKMLFPLMLHNLFDLFILPYFHFVYSCHLRIACWMLYYFTVFYAPVNFKCICIDIGAIKERNCVEPNVFPVNQRAMK